MRDYKEIEARYNNNISALKEVYDEFSIAPNISFDRDSIQLEFDRGSAIESARVGLDYEGYIVISIGCWCAVTPKAKKNIEGKRFDNAREALVYALETTKKINSFFDQF